MNIKELQDTLQKLTNTKISQTEIAKILGKDRSNINAKAKRGTELKFSEIKKIEQYFNIIITRQNIETTIKQSSLPVKYTQIKYFPNLYLTNGYETENLKENYETIIIDEQFLSREHGIKINPKNCKIVRISGNSLNPEYNHGDRVIVDEADKNLTDGQIYAFSYCGQFYVKEINRAGNKIKCISINKNYEQFFIEDYDNLKITGRILPRIRL